MLKTTVSTAEVNYPDTDSHIVYRVISQLEIGKKFFGQGKQGKVREIDIHLCKVNMSDWYLVDIDQLLSMSLDVYNSTDNGRIYRKPLVYFVYI